MTYDRLAQEFTPTRCAALDAMLALDPEIGMTRLRWLGTGPVEASPAAVKAEVAKLVFVRGLDAHTLGLSLLPAERRRFLAMVGPPVDRAGAGAPRAAAPVPDPAGPSNGWSSANWWASPPVGVAALAQAGDELHEALGELERVLEDGDGPVRLDDHGELVISPLTAEDVPTEATRSRRS